MLIHFVLFLLVWQSPESTPNRAKEDYTVKLNYDIRQRQAVDKTVINWESHNAGGRDDRMKTGMLPYLIVKVTILNRKDEEYRIKCQDNRGTVVLNKKMGKVSEYEVDMGFIDDIKDHISASAYTIYILDEKKKPLNQIEMLVTDEAKFLVNGEERGRF
ncbi:MAG: hypothetical protein WDO14_22195 [Bacteroidota bacterium]